MGKRIEFCLVLTGFLVSSLAFSKADHGTPSSLQFPADAARVSAGEVATDVAPSPAYLEAQAAMEKAVEKSENAIPSIIEEELQTFVMALNSRKPKLETALGNAFIHHELYEEAEVFGDLLKALSPEERVRISVEYTERKKAVREKMLAVLEAELSKSPDARLKAMALAVKEAGKSNLKAYDDAKERILEEKLESPICFTCGGKVSGKYESFSVEMKKAAQAALLQANLVGENGSSGAFYNGDFGRLSDGKVVKAYLGEGGVLTAGNYLSESSEKMKRQGRDPGLVASVRQFYEGALQNAEKKGKAAFTNPADEAKVRAFLQKTKDFASAVSAPVATTALAAPSSAAKSEAPAAFSHPVDRYLHSLGGEPPSSEMTMGDFAEAVGLVNPANPKEPYLQYVGLDGSTKFGVQVNWQTLKAADLAERKRVADILTKIASADGPKFYKVENKYCLWCNLRNHPDSKSNFRQLLEGIKADSASAPASGR